MTVHLPHEAQIRCKKFLLRLLPASKPRRQRYSAEMHGHMQQLQQQRQQHPRIGAPHHQARPDARCAGGPKANMLSTIRRSGDVMTPPGRRLGRLWRNRRGLYLPKVRRPLQLLWLYAALTRWPPRLEAGR